MGNWIGEQRTAHWNVLAKPNGQQEVGGCSLAQPEIAIRDLRHPNQIRPVFSIRRKACARSYQHGFSRGRQNWADCQDFGRNDLGSRPNMINRMLLEDRPDG